MELPADYKPEFDSLRNLLLEIAPERSMDRLLKRVVQNLGQRPHAVLAQLWLIDEGSGPSRGLNLVAGEESAPSEIAGQNLRIPLGAGAIGRIAATGEAFLSNDPVHDLPEYNWLGPRGVRGFNGQPVTFQNEVLGVLAQFNRIPNPEQSAAWLRIFADHVGGAIANARAFEEIEKLKSRLELENTLLQEEVQEARAFGEMVGESAVLRRLLRQVELVARTDATVLILGESGTGKELVAREIHKRSQRGGRPLIRVNCASIPKELYESEFFGHVKGAFTGAVKDRAGRFEAAHGGTLFLDEVGEIPLELQSKFLRVLQEGQYERVGEEKTRTVDVRIIAATNRDLPKDVETGRFRQDLYYRLNVFPLKVAPLRERKEDIAPLAAHFVNQTARKLKLPPTRLSPAHVAQLESYDWPGNIRELQNAIERALILAQDGVLLFDFPAGQKIFLPSPSAAPNPGNATVVTDLEFRGRERDNILAALNQTRWKIHGPGGTAELLGVKPTTLISRMKKLGLKRPV